MPRRALRTDLSPAPAAPSRPAPALAKADAHARISPAHELQRHVQARLSAHDAPGEATGEATGEAKWSTRRTLAFIVGSSCALWAGIGGLAYIALR